MSIKVELKKGPNHKEKSFNFSNELIFKKITNPPLTKKTNLFKKPENIILVHNSKKDTAYYLDEFEPAPGEFLNKEFNFYKISYAEYKKKLEEKEWVADIQHNTLTPMYGALSVFVTQTVSFYFANTLPNSKEGFDAIARDPGNPFNIGLQTGYPVVANLIFGIAHYMHSHENFIKTKGRAPTKEENDALMVHSAMLATKGLFASGAWELGLFVGQLIITACHFTPHTVWVPITLILASALFQAIMAVAMQVAIDRQKPLAERMSAHDYAKLFLTSFLSGAMYTALGLVPGLPFLATYIFKPIAHVLGNIGVGLVIGTMNALTSLMISRYSGAVYDKTIKPISEKILNFSLWKQPPKSAAHITELLPIAPLLEHTQPFPLNLVSV